MKRVLIISRQQFGYLVDLYKWCEHLNDDYQIDVLTFEGRPKIELNKENVHVHYVSYNGNKTIRGIRFILACIWYIMRFNGTIIIEYFKGCYVFKKIFPKKKMILDIRTLSVKDDKRARVQENLEIKNACKKFDFVTIISEGTREAISLDKKKSAIIPLGSDIISKKNKCFDNLNLLYVGTLSGREIEKTIKGLGLYLKENPSSNIHYDIIGDGFNNELDILKELVKKLNISQHITLHGFKPHTEIQPFFEECNVGVSFVPITEYYEYQPPTKTYEYILSGLYTIATDTFCNRELINNENGILINDNEEAFAKAISKICKTRKTLNSETIRKTLINSTWERIVNNILHEVLKDI